MVRLGAAALGRGRPRRFVPACEVLEAIAPKGVALQVRVSVTHVPGDSEASVKTAVA
jgi:hypothetical protein